MKKKKPIPKLKKDVWKLWSVFIRKENADYRGYVACVTCGAVYLWDSGMIHAGHWIHDKLDFDKRNIHPQCRNCNYNFNKNVNTAYAVYMARTYGADEMDNIRKEAERKGNNYTRDELEEVINLCKIQ